MTPSRAADTSTPSHARSMRAASHFYDRFSEATAITG